MLPFASSLMLADPDVRPPDPVTISPNPQSPNGNVTGANGFVDLACNPSGGRAPYTYSWSKVAGSSKLGLTNASSRVATVTYVGLNLNEQIAGTYRIFVRDADGLTGEQNVLVALTRTS